MRRSLLLLTTLLASVSSSALALDGVVLLPDGEGAALALALPDGWTADAVPTDPSGPAEPVETLAVLRPPGPAAGHIELGRAGRAGDSDTLLDRIELRLRQSCAAVQYGDRLPFLSGPLSGTVTTLGCTERHGTGRGEIRLITTVPGDLTTWVLQRVWEVDAFDVMATPIDSEALRTGAAEMGRFALCRADTITETCPQPIADAIAGAGGSSDPVLP